MAVNVGIAPRTNFELNAAVQCYNSRYDQLASCLSKMPVILMHGLELGDAYRWTDIKEASDIMKK
jgi:hypothetical protein